MKRESNKTKIQTTKKKIERIHFFSKCVQVK
jgi:hypothetical protein